MRYAPTTSQTNRFSEPAQVDHGKPSARAACSASNAVCTSHPTRTPHVARRPARPGCRASPKYATAASLYASNAGQKSSSANCDRLPLDVALLHGELGQLRELPLQALQLQRDDEHVREQDHENHEVHGCDVLLFRAHCSASRRSRSRSSSRFPASSRWYSVAASVSRARTATQNVANCDAAMFGPPLSNATGWMNRSDNRIASTLMGTST